MRSPDTGGRITVPDNRQGKQLLLMKLPKFKNPPVVEVALSVQFQQPESITVAHLGLAWDHYRDRFPRVEQHAPIARTIERKGARVPMAEQQLSISTDFDTIPRLWLISNESDELLQLQGDKFVRNWRRYHDQTLKYPSFAGRIRPEFEKDFRLFSDFSQKQGWGDLNIDQCEVTYINHISACSVWHEHSQLDRVFKGWSPNYPVLPGTAKPEGVVLKIRHEIVDNSGKFLGRLHVDATSAFSIKDEHAPVLLLQLVARGQPRGSGIDGVMAFMDLGHETIVRSFAELTTNEMHKVWERIQ
jgi:uncharacterized protein (TIGR04255 family)